MPAPTTQHDSPLPLRGSRVLVTGGTGYVGGQLVIPLLRAGAQVRVLARRPPRTSPGSRVHVVEGDAARAADVRRAVADVDVAYYLLHSMDDEGDLADRERAMAEVFADECAEAGVRQIVYLGGPRAPGELSTHLRSRATVGEILLAAPVPTVVLQAPVIIGAGSASFKMIRYLTYRLPVTVAPSWVRNLVQPIGIEDVLTYLVAAASLDPPVNRTFDIGGPEVLSYADLAARFARAAGLSRRMVIPMPFLRPGPTLAGHAVSLLAPVPPGLAGPLVGSLAHDAVAADHDIRDVLAISRPLTTLDEALRQAEQSSARDLTVLHSIAWAAGSAARALRAARRGTGRRSAG
ncbi:NAD(P)H-binding protein [Cumulibacter manganitolerans]|uniref:NAD(P)H-binding protein n=1 Tax=Cumulibacter manganitolerans TaxID=1884992 RepID=UPI001296515B|nr:NAD(P)H-binding protein [Cumulibacter manganitolerans]